ncbi:MAG: hypothetical protein Q8Q09_21025 [Deltaproteobacteria bacterium]|nr:hypothetical protein [Deltaproteobacteria bacterium]
MRRPIQRGMATALATLTALVGCQAFDRAEFRRLSGGSDARSDTGDASLPMRDIVEPPNDGNVACAPTTIVQSPTCTLAVVPDLPSGLRNVAGSTTRVFAARGIAFGASGAWRRTGFDRDGLCSAPMSGPTPCRSALVLGDGDEGRDNTLAAVIGQAGVIGSAFDETRLNAGIARGNSTVGLRISDYGGINDGAVRVEWLVLTEGHGAAGRSAPLRFDGTDAWSVDRDTTYQADLRTPRISTGEAFASCGTLVVPFANSGAFLFPADGTRPKLTLTDTRLVGSITADGTITNIDLSSIWTRANIYDDMRSFGVCPELAAPQDWFLLQAGVEAALDILGSGRANPAASCDAMTAAFRLTLVPIRVEGEVPSPPITIPDPCRPQDAGRG